MNRIDLHIHSNCSDDGELSVHEILDASKNMGMKTISITDHNCVRGVSEAIGYGKQLGIEVVSGIEIDCTYNSVNLHLLGYFINQDMKEFDQLEQDIFDQEAKAFQQKIENLREIGIVVDEGELLQKAAGRITCGELIGEVVLNKAESIENELLKPYLKGGERSNMPYLNFYRDFFAQGKAAYVPLRYLQLKDAIELVRKSNGIPVIAHPGENLKDNMDMIDSIIKEGVMGIEVFSNYHTPGQIEYFYNKSKEHKLLVSCGSDFHGKNKPGIKIGECNCTIDEAYLVDSLKAACP